VEEYGNDRAGDGVVALVVIGRHRAVEYTSERPGTCDRTKNRKGLFHMIFTRQGSHYVFRIKESVPT
jgi:hypothetical protein